MLRFRLVARLLCSAATLCLANSVAATAQAQALRRITNTPEQRININPSLSGDGLRLAFESTADVAQTGGSDAFRAVRADVGAGPPQFIQLAVSRAVAPALSQDGTRIAFASAEDLTGSNPDGNSEIFFFDGTILRQITFTLPDDVSRRTFDGNFQPSISDDGRFIAFSSNRDLVGFNRDANFEIFIFDADTQSIAQITSTTGTVGATDAKISGNGFRIAYVRDSSAVGTLPARRDLVVYDRVGRTSRTVAANVTNLTLTYGRAISDDGLRVVYAMDTAPNESQVMLFDGRNDLTRQITALGSRVEDIRLHPTISGDGLRIAFATRRNVARLNSDGSAELYVYDLPTDQFIRVTSAPNGTASEIISSLSDDGSRVAFNFPRILSGPVTGDFANNPEIYLADIAARPLFSTDMTVLNGASLGQEPATTTAIAPDQIAVVMGANFARETVRAQRLIDGSFPRRLGGATVTVNGRAAQILYVSSSQVTFVVPGGTPTGDGQIIVTNLDGFETRGAVLVARAAPGIFTLSGDGQGPAVALDAGTLLRGPFDPSPTPNGPRRLALFATGARHAAELTVTIGGLAARIAAIAAAPDLPGLDQINIELPAELRGIGTASLTVRADGRDSNMVTISFVSVAPDTARINEVLADPPDGAAGDANRDGERSGTDDEFVEIVNASDSPLNISGWTLRTRSLTGSTETIRHRFVAGTILPAGAALVVFGGGNVDPANPFFGGAQIFTASSGSLSLANNGATILLRDGAGQIISQLSYGTPGDDFGGDAVNQSFTRAPDVTGPFARHTTAAGANGRRFSPGTRADAMFFRPRAGGVARVEIAPADVALNRGGSQQLTARGLDQNGQVVPAAVFTWASSDTSVVTVDERGIARGVGVGVATITATTPSGVTGEVSGRVSLIVRVPLIINEILADVPPDDASTPAIEGDANRDGMHDSADDEFIELVNNSRLALDVSGIVISDSTGNRFTFPANSTLAAGQAAVVFGGGAPQAFDPAFGGALIFTAGSLGLNDAGDTVTLKLAVGTNEAIIASQSYGTGSRAPAPSNQSLTRAPDAQADSAGGDYVAHTSAADAAGRVFSPGTRADGTPFNSPTITRIAITPPSSTISVGAAQSFTARAYSSAAGTEVEVPNVSFVWDVSDTARAALTTATGASTTVTGTAAGTIMVRARAGSEQSVAWLTLTPVVSSIDLAPASAAVAVGQTIIFTATARDGGGNPVSGVSFSFSLRNSSPADAATIASTTANTVTVRGAFPGSTIVVASYTRPSDGAVIEGTSALSISVPSVPVPGEVIINEALVSFAASATQPRSDFLELFNTTSQTLDLSGLVITFRPGGSGNTPSAVTLPGAVGSRTTLMPPNGYFLIVNGAETFGVAADFNASGAGFDLNNTTGGIKIEIGGVKLDGLTYQGSSAAPAPPFNTFGEGPIFIFSSGTTNDLIRSPNARDTNNNASDFRRNGAAAAVSPKATNP
jgi:uncharacterized protein (TIGR03437 family)